LASSSCASRSDSKRTDDDALLYPSPTGTPHARHVVPPSDALPLFPHVATSLLDKSFVSLSRGGEDEVEDGTRKPEPDDVVERPFQRLLP
ncbi:unnamed protein product, partial [Amoebophrya sp. A120]